MNKALQAFSRYVPVNDEARRWEIFCNDAGRTEVPPGSPYPLDPDLHPKNYVENLRTGRILKEFQVVYIVHGSGHFHSNGFGEATIQKGDVFLLFPGVEHHYFPNPDTGWHEYWVGFSGSHPKRLLKNGVINSLRPVYHIGLNQDILADFEGIIQLCRQQTPGFQILLGAIILQLLAHLRVAETVYEGHDYDRELIDRARKAMRDNIYEDIQVKDIACECGVGYTTLLEIFKKYTGMTPYQYFLQLRMHLAKELLSERSVAVKEIAARLNFENQYYFSRIFKKKTGMPPTMWRQSAQL